MKLTILHRSILITIVNLTIGFSSSFAAKSNNESDFVTQIANTFNHLNKKPMLWPEFNIKETPSIFYFENKHNYAFNFSPTNPHWEQHTNASYTAYFLKEDEYHINHIPWTFGTLIDNQASFLFKVIDEISIQNNIHILLHERFHIFQLKHFPIELFWEKDYSGFNHIENVKLSLLEAEVVTENRQNFRHFLNKTNLNPSFLS